MFKIGFQKKTRNTKNKSHYDQAVSNNTEDVGLYTRISNEILGK